MNEKKHRIYISLRKVIKCVDDKAWDEKCVGSLQKQTMGVIFSLQNSQLLTISLPTEEIFLSTRPK